MNIFEILSYGDGRVHEAQMSSVLGFLFDPHAPHGYKTTPLAQFVGSFGEVAKSALFAAALRQIEDIPLWISSFTRIDLKLEEIVRDSGGSKKRKDLDLVVRFYKNDQLKLVILIENKINDGAAVGRPNQLNDEYNFLRKAIDDEVVVNGQTGARVPLIFIYLTPEKIDQPGMSASLLQWRSLELPEKSSAEQLDFKLNYSWKMDRTVPEETSARGDMSVESLLLVILDLERAAKINPASSHADLILRSLIKFIRNNFKAEDTDYDDWTIRENGFQPNTNQEFWNKWSGNKLGSYQFATDLVAAMAAYATQKIVERNLSNIYTVKPFTSKLRLNLCLDHRDYPYLEERRSPPGRLLNLRFDGQTSQSKIDVTFDRREGLDYEDFFANLCNETKSWFEASDVTMSDASGGNRTILYISVHPDVSGTDVSHHLEPLMDEAIEAVLGRF